MLSENRNAGCPSQDSGISERCHAWTADSSDDKHSLAERQEYLLASMRLARANLQSWQLALDEIGLALKQRLITVDAACDELAELGLLRYLPEPEQRAAA